MSMKKRISTLDKKTKKRVIAILYANGCAYEDVSMLLKEGTLADLEEYIDIKELM